MKLRAKSLQAFSLIEIAMALGIVGFAMVAILGMFPMALDAAKDSRVQSRVAVIGQTIFSDLRSGPHRQAPVVIATPASDPASVAFLDLTAPVTETYVLYNSSGRPLTKLTINQYKDGLSAYSDAEFVARIRTKPDPNLPGLALVGLQIETPSVAATSRRKIYRLATHIGDSR